MSIRDYFRPVSTWSVEKVREFIAGRDPEEYNLIDVRQPDEYGKEHLPGAMLIPVGDLGERLREIDPRKTTITY